MKLDPRLEGKASSQITKKFVTDNLTKEEWNTKLTKTEKSYGELDVLHKYGAICKVTTVEHLLNELKKCVKEGKGIGNIQVDSWGSHLDSCRFEYTYETEVPLALDKYPLHYQKLWREQLKTYNKECKEYEQYLELKSKYEEVK